MRIMEQSIDFLICNYNGGDLLKRCIKSIINGNFINSNIYIYDNASTDDSLERLEELGSKQYTLIRGLSNIGYGKAINKLFDISGAEYIFILNPDSELEFGNLELSSFLENIGNKEILGFSILNPNGTIQNFEAVEPDFISVIGGLLRVGFPSIIEPFYNYFFAISNKRNNAVEIKECVDFVSGCALLMKRISFLEIGKFNPDYFLYYEDTELMHKAKSVGFCIRKVSLNITHNASYSFKNSSYLIRIEKYRSAFIYFQNTKGLHYSLIIRLGVILVSLLSLFNVYNIFKRRLGLYFLTLILMSVRP